ncbi:MAG: hypothetical protein JWM64_2974 [Frankiales bacterium]|nr:hypothetical protein [Frankiales bacterium]
MHQVDDEEDRLAALRALDLLDTPAEERFDRVTRLCQRLFGVSKAAVTLVDRDRTFVKSGAGMPTGDTPRVQSVCDTTIRSVAPLVIRDMSADEKYAGMPVVRSGVRFYAGVPLVTPSGARVGALCLFDESPRELTSPETTLLSEIAGWVQNELAVDEELERAAEVQRDLLPSRPGDLPGYSLLGTCVTSRQVGGDLYDWYSVGGGTALTVADVMGKGLGAAIVMASLRSVLRAATRYRGVQAAVGIASESLQTDFEQSGTFATLFHGVLEHDTGFLHYVDAGHGLGLLVRADGTTSRLESGGLPAGVLPDVTWRVGELTLLPGDTLVLYSDGLLDLHADRDAVDRQVVEAVAAGTGVAGVLEHLTWAVRLVKLPDDVTVVVLRRDA